MAVEDYLYYYEQTYIEDGYYQIEPYFDGDYMESGYYESAGETLEFNSNQTTDFSATIEVLAIRGTSADFDSVVSQSTSVNIEYSGNSQLNTEFAQTTTLGVIYNFDIEFDTLFTPNVETNATVIGVAKLDSVLSIATDADLIADIDNTLESLVNLDLQAAKTARIDETLTSQSSFTTDSTRTRTFSSSIDATSEITIGFTKEYSANLVTQSSLDVLSITFTPRTPSPYTETIVYPENKSPFVNGKFGQALNLDIDSTQASEGTSIARKGNTWYIQYENTVYTTTDFQNYTDIGVPSSFDIQFKDNLNYDSGTDTFTVRSDTKFWHAQSTPSNFDSTQSPGDNQYPLFSPNQPKPYTYWERQNIDSNGRANIVFYAYDDRVYSSLVESVDFGYIDGTTNSLNIRWYVARDLGNGFDYYFFQNGATNLNVARQGVNGLDLLQTNTTTDWIDGLAVFDNEVHYGEGTELKKFPKDNSLPDLDNPQTVASFSSKIRRIDRSNNVWYVICDDAVYKGTDLTNLSDVSNDPIYNIVFKSYKTAFVNNESVVEYRPAKQRHKHDVINDELYLYNGAIFKLDTNNNWSVVGGPDTRSRYFIYRKDENSFTVKSADFWAKTTEDRSVFDLVDTNNNRFTFQIVNAGIDSDGVIINYAGSEIANVNQTISTGWHHYRVLIESNRVVVYFDGARIVDTSASISNQSFSYIRPWSTFSGDLALDNLYFDEDLLNSPDNASITVPDGQLNTTLTTIQNQNFDGNLDNTDSVVFDVELDFASTASFDVDLSLIKQGRADFSANASVDVEPTVIISNSADIAANSAVQATATRIFALNSESSTQFDLANNIDVIRELKSSQSLTASITATATRIHQADITTEAVASSMVVAAQNASGVADLDSNFSLTAQGNQKTGTVIAFDGKFTQQAETYKVKFGAASNTATATLDVSASRQRSTSSDQTATFNQSVNSGRIAGLTSTQTSLAQLTADANYFVGVSSGLDAEFTAQTDADATFDLASQALSEFTQTTSITVQYNLQPLDLVSTTTVTASLSEFSYLPELEYVIQPEDRTHTVPSESRVHTIPNEVRVHVIQPEDRVYTIIEENRTWRVQ